MITRTINDKIITRISLNQRNNSCDAVKIKDLNFVDIYTNPINISSIRMSNFCDTSHKSLYIHFKYRLSYEKIS